MKWSGFYAPTLREDPREAEIASHRLLVRAGFIRKVASGIYDVLPLGVRTMSRIENIVREEMNRAGAVEVRMPFVIPAELWQETGRWDLYGKELLRFRDRAERWFCLGPTHEEVVVDIVRRAVRSYRELPMILYQIGPKFRDEIRPRFGLMRAREFVMKDAYSFDVDEKGLEDSYRKMFEAYIRIFKRCGLTFEAVEAATGAIGGHFSHEFMAIADTGEDVIMYCPRCGYAANRELAERRAPRKDMPEAGNVPPLEKVHTPGKRTVEEVSSFLNVNGSKLFKSLIYITTEGESVMAVASGDREINEDKLARYLGVEAVNLADAITIERVTGAPVGFAGPVGIKGVRIICDYSVLETGVGVTGANEEDHHFVNVLPGRDFPVDEIADISFAENGDPCPRCESGMLGQRRGIEVGHLFKLGTKYSVPMRCTFLDRDGNEVPAVMGCYGIGIGRTMAAVVEQSHDDRGIIWPVTVAPFEVALLLLNPSDRAQSRAAEEIYTVLQRLNVDVIVDDREERPGVKFNDADLIGFPYQIIAGKKVKEGKVEVKKRDTGERVDVSIENAPGVVTEMIKQEKETFEK